MKKIKIIHWDDDKDAGIDVKVTIQRYFGDDNVEYLFFDSSIDEFEKKLITENMPFDLLIQDLLDKNGSLVGIKILKQLPKESKVIVLTQSGDPKVQKELKDPIITVDYKKLYKSDLIIHGMGLLVSEIENKTGLKRIQYTPVALKWDKNDIIADYQVSIITKEHLEKLIVEYLSNKKGKYPPLKKNVKINPLVSGYSGAIVFQVEFFYEPKASLPILLKVDKIRSNIEKELGLAIGYNYKQINPDYKLEYDNKVLKSEIDGICWYALTADFIVEGKTLKSIILKAKNYKKIDALLVTLFKKCLNNVYLNNIKSLQNGTFIYPFKDLMNILTKKKKAFILNTTKELSPLLSTAKTLLPRHDENNESKVKDIFNFQNEQNVLKPEQSKKYNKIVLVHGDMHGNNIMVSKDDQIKIIDPANMGSDYWTRDLCMLIVDLFAYGIDYGEKEYFGIKRIKDWRDMGNCLLKGTAIENRKKNKVVCKVLSNLTNQQYIKNNLGFEPWYEDWEFQLSLVVEFLRISYKSNQLPAGKRAACMLIAFDGFKQAKKSYRTLVKSK